MKYMWNMMMIPWGCVTLGEERLLLETHRRGGYNESVALLLLVMVNYSRKCPPPIP